MAKGELLDAFLLARTRKLPCGERVCGRSHVAGPKGGF